MWAPMLVMSLIMEVVSLDNSSSELIGEMLARSTGPDRWLGLLTVGIGIPVLEELLFRGYLWSAMERWAPPWLVVVVTTAIFAVLHGSPAHVLGVLWIGVWLAWLRLQSGSIWPSAITHIVNNTLITAMMFEIVPEVPQTGLIVLGIGGGAATGALAFAAGRLGRRVNTGSNRIR